MSVLENFRVVATERGRQGGCFRLRFQNVFTESGAGCGYPAGCQPGLVDLGLDLVSAPSLVVITPTSAPVRLPIIQWNLES
jgi:hypothetical protein